MRRAASYFRLQAKRLFKLTPTVLLLSALLFGAIGLEFFGVFSGNKSDEKDSLIKIGIVGDMEDSYLGMAVNALKNLDSSRFSISVETTDDEQAAASKLRKGELVAYIVMPDDFIEEAIRGNYQKVVCVTSSGAADFGARIANELMATVTQIVENSQKAVFGFQNAARDSGIDESQVGDMGSQVALEVIDVILRRETAYTVSEIGNGGEMNLNDPLVCGMIILLIMMWGITCCTVFSARSRALDRVLSSKGTGAAAQVFGEYIAYLLFMTVIMAFMAAVSYLALSFAPPMEMLENYDFFRFLPGIIVPIIVISAMQFFLYEIAGSVVSGALLQFFAAAGMGYICGCIYPALFFPRGVQTAASILPAWNCRIWLDELLAGKPTLTTFLILAAYFVLFMLLSVTVRRVRIKHGGGAA